MNAVAVLVCDVSDCCACCKRQTRIEGANPESNEQQGDEFGFHGLFRLVLVGSFVCDEQDQISSGLRVIPWGETLPWIEPVRANTTLSIFGSGVRFQRFSLFRSAAQRTLRSRCVPAPSVRGGFSAALGRVWFVFPPDAC